MRVLVACEFSGTVRDAFLRHGHDAMSCDLLPTESPGPHYQGDMFDVVDDGWGLMIAHPECTYLCNSGVRWLHERPERWPLMRKGAEFFRRVLDVNIPRIAVENPVMHKYAAEIIGRRQDFTVQPWQFGDGYIKRTCFWTKNLPPLIPTTEAEGREAAVHRASPGPDRWKKRSITYPGIADAIAAQWGAL